MTSPDKFRVPTYVFSLEKMERNATEHTERPQKLLITNILLHLKEERKQGNATQHMAILGKSKNTH